MINVAIEKLTLKTNKLPKIKFKKESTIQPANKPGLHEFEVALFCFRPKRDWCPYG